MTATGTSLSPLPSPFFPSVRLSVWSSVCSVVRPMPYINVVKALYSYEAADSDELSFSEDELLCILPGGGDRDDSWLLAMPLKRSEVSGLVPANYVEPVWLRSHLC